MTRDTPFDENALAIVRRAYAKQILALAGVSNSPRLEDAFATVRREHFLGEPPWIMAQSGGYDALPFTEPVLVYQDINFELAPERGVNNGQPSLHASWLHHGGLSGGEQVVHIGAGTGYYTALIAHLVGTNGHVRAVEFDPVLAARATKNLAHLANVTVIQDDGFRWPREKADFVYVSFAVDRPADAWVDNLKMGGRLVFPLGVPRPDPSPGGGRHSLYGAGLRVERADAGFTARWLGPASFVCAEGVLAETEAGRRALLAAFERDDPAFVRSLRWKQPASADRCWFVGSDWALCYDDVA
jgi:protein-L-isoaspartate(D-aspartate) O-methyltransferase